LETPQKFALLLFATQALIIRSLLVLGTCSSPASTGRDWRSCCSQHFFVFFRKGGIKDGCSDHSADERVVLEEMFPRWEEAAHAWANFVLPQINAPKVRPNPLAQHDANSLREETRFKVRHE
jgi:hypothetical protein